MQRKLGAEFLGTLWLVLGGCGTAILAGTAVGFLGVSLAFGLTVVTMAYAIGPISGCHLNPAVTIGLAAAGRHPKSEVLPYIVAQVLGAIVGAGVIYVIASSRTGWTPGGFAANGFGDLSPTRASLVGALVCEVVMTAFFLFVILGVTAKGSAAGFAGLAIGLCLVLIHLVSIPVTNTSVNPARSTGPALFAGSEYLVQLWLFWLAPIGGAILGALAWRWLSPSEQPTQPVP